MNKLLEYLVDAGVHVNVVQIPLGQDRGFVRISENGDVEFHSIHIPDEDLYPGQEDYVTFKPTADDVNLFRVIADHTIAMFSFGTDGRASR